MLLLQLLLLFVADPRGEGAAVVGVEDLDGRHPALRLLGVPLGDGRAVLRLAHHFLELEAQKRPAARAALDEVAAEVLAQRSAEVTAKELHPRHFYCSAAGQSLATSAVFSAPHDIISLWSTVSEVFVGT